VIDVEIIPQIRHPEIIIQETVVNRVQIPFLLYVLFSIQLLCFFIVAGIDVLH